MRRRMSTFVGLSSTIRIRPLACHRSSRQSRLGHGGLHDRRRRSSCESSSSARLGLAQGQLAVENAAGRRALFSAQIRPWWPATISRQIASPRPVPPLPDFVLLDWTNLSNTSLQFVGRDSRPFVANADQTASCRRGGRRTSIVPSRRRELHRVAQQVADHLLEPLGIDQGGRVSSGR